MNSRRRNRIPDIVGIGALNIDFTVTSEKMKELPAFKVSEAMKSFEPGAERLVGEEDIENMLALLGRDSFRETLGGSAFNTICAIASLGSGIRTGFAGIEGAGRDSLSFRRALDALSVDSTWLGDCGEENSGLCISLNHSGTRSFIYYPGCNRRMGDFLEERYEGVLKYLAGSRMIHITQFSNRETSEVLERLVKDARRENPSIAVSCDPGYAWLENRIPPVEGILRLSDYIFLNEMEFSLLAGGGKGLTDKEKADRILSICNRPDTLVIVKKETEIKLYSRKAGELAFGIDVISSEKISDATGAGDVFDAGFLAAVLLGCKDMRMAVDLGNRLMRAKLGAY